MKILYFADGTGTGTLVKGLALRRAAQRSGRHEVGLALGTDFPHLIGGGLNDFVRHWTPGAHNLTWLLADAVGAYKPDIIVSCYTTQHIQEWLRCHKVPAVLLWRTMLAATPLLRGLEPDTFLKVYRFEKITKDLLDEVIPAERVVDINPLYSVWPEELASQSEARAVLHASWAMHDTGRPLRVIAHNGWNTEEVDIVIREGMALRRHNEFTTIALSQNLASNGRFLAQPLEQFMRGIDHLVAASGPTIFWSWQHFKRPEAGQTWLPVGRGHDPQVIRSRLAPEKLIRSPENGADQLLTELEKL